MRRFVIPRCIHTPNLKFLPQIILEICCGHDYSKTRSAVKVIVTRKWYMTLCYPKMHPHTKFGIPNSKNMSYAPDTIILKTRSEVKVTVTQKWYVTSRHPKMHLHTKFGIPISKNIGDMHQFLETRSEVKFKVTVTQL